MQIKNVLIITHHYLNGVGGGVFASRAYINAFAHIFENISLLCPAQTNDNIESYEIEKKVHIIPVEYKLSKIHKLLNICTGNFNRFHNMFKIELENNKFDLIIFDNSKASSKLIDIAKSFNCKVITIHHNCESEYIKDNMSGLLKHILLFWIKKYEKESILKSDLNFTLTEYDKNKFNTIYDNNKIVKIENSGCFEYREYDFTPTENTSNSNNNFLITGNLSAKQTVDSLSTWIDNYYPILKKVYPNCKLTIAGKNPSNSLIKKCQSLDITIISSPQSMESLLLKANFYICPISKGGGIKLRVMDGLKAGLPVICHAISARGYETMVSKGYVIPYCDTQSFELAIKKSLSLVYNKSKIISEYKQYYSFQAGVHRIQEIINNFL